jgi:hypothetical protein
MYGGLGFDLFIVSRESGDDVIGDFQATNDSPFVDRIDLQALSDLFQSFSDVEARSNQSGSDLVIELDSTNTLTLEDTTIEDLDADDFIFG